MVDLVNDFVSFKLSAAFDVSDATELETNQVIEWLKIHYLSRIAIELENVWFNYKETVYGDRKLIKLMNEVQPKWLCKCGEINTASECKSLRPNIDHVRVKWLEDPNKAKMSEKEDLFHKFYADEKVLLSAMDSEMFRIHEEELAKIAFEAKARLTAIVDHKKELQSARTPKQKEWIVNRTDAEEQLVSDAINTVQTRKKRMNKIEKLQEQLKGFVDEETMKKVIGNVEKKATEKSVSLISFVQKKTEETKKEESEESNGNSVPFDPSKLKFGV